MRMTFSQRVRCKFTLERRYKKVINFGWKVITLICRARLSGRFAYIQNWGDIYAGITIPFFATIIANIGGPDEAPRSIPSWSTLLQKHTYVGWLMSTMMLCYVFRLTYTCNQEKKNFLRLFHG